MLDESAVLAATDVLMSLCQRVREESLDLELLDWEASHPLYRSSAQLMERIQLDNLAKSDIETASPSELWKSILLLLAHADLSVAEEEDYDDFAHRLSPQLQRLCGAVFCTCDYILDCNAEYRRLVMLSLRQVFHSQPQNILQLFLNYRSLFSYSYMFLRRIGKFNKASRDTLEELFSAHPDTPADEQVKEVDPLWDQPGDPRDSDSLIEKVLSPEDEAPPRLPSKDKESKTKVPDVSKPRASILIRSNSDSAPQRNLSRSVSFSTDVASEGPSPWEGRRGLVDSIARISSQNLVSLDDSQGEASPTGASLSPLSAGDSASSFGLEVEELEDDIETFNVPQKTEPIKPRVLTGVRTITTPKARSKTSGSESQQFPVEEDSSAQLVPHPVSDMSAPRNDTSAAKATTPKELVDQEESHANTAEATHGDQRNSNGSLVVEKYESSTDESALVIPENNDNQLIFRGDYDANKSDDKSNPIVRRDSSSIPKTDLPMNRITERRESRSANATDSSTNILSVSEDAKPPSNRFHTEDENSSEEIIIPQRIDSFDSLSPGKSMNKRSQPSELRRLNSSFARLSRPPLPSKSHSTGSLLTSVAMDKSIVVHPRERTDMAYETNTMMEGWMEKKSERTGLWLRVI